MHSHNVLMSNMSPKIDLFKFPWKTIEKSILWIMANWSAECWRTFILIIFRKYFQSDIEIYLKPDWRENFYWLIQEPLTSWFQRYITLISQNDKSQSYSSPKIEFGSRNRHKTRPNFYFWGAVTMRYFILRYKCDTSLNSGSQGLFNELIKIFTPVWL